MAEPEVQDLRDALEKAGDRQRETDHRAKNTLQLIVSLIQLQSRRAGDENVRRALRDLLQRIAAVSVAHRRTEHAAGREQVDVAGLVKDLASELAASAGRPEIEIALDLDPALAPARHGPPLALIASEALANALRHAFPDARRGRIRVELRREPDALRLSVTDNGVGSPALAAGLGMTLIRLMSQQIRAALQVEPAQPGLRVAVSVPMEPDGETSV